MMINWRVINVVLHSRLLFTLLFLHYVTLSWSSLEQTTTPPSQPSLDGTSKEPIFAIVDEDVFIDCRVDFISNFSLVWRYIPPTARDGESSSGDIIAAGMVRVTSDIRFDVLHEEGSPVWVLRVRQVKTSDSGIYVCEVNTTPKKRISRILAVTDEDLGVLPGSTGTPSILEVDHNYTDCCIKESVPSQCHHFCHFRGLLDTQPQGTVHSCINHLTSITKCLADGRDHMPCCRKQNVPEVCRPVCVGNFSLSTVLDHFTCMHYTAPVLACIAEGVTILPPLVSDISVDPISSTTVNVSWTLPRVMSKAALIETIQVNITQLHTFDGVGVRLSPEKTTGDDFSTGRGSESEGGGSHEEPPSLYGLQMRYSVPGNESSFLISDLKPYTMYQVQVKCINRAGSSMASNAIRTLTLLPSASDKDKDKKPSSTTEGGGSRQDEGREKEKEGVIPSRDKESVDDDDEGEDKTKGKPVDGSSSTEDKKRTSTPSGGEKEETETHPPKKDKKNSLPDMKSCCRSKGVVIDRCVNILCDPVRSDEATLTDLMICAPFANATFSCVADGKDHTSCCRSRGVSPNCLELCSGNVKKIDFRHFVCLDQLSSFSSCILDHHGVLPGTPSHFMVVNVHHDWAIVKWNPPKEPPSVPTATKFLIHYRDVNKDDPSSYSVATARTSPFLLDKLSPGGRYEVYVKAANEYGTSQGSSRVVFSTPPLYSNDEIEVETTSSSYNETQCCARAGLSNDCLPLCSYRVKVTDVLHRASSCAQHLPTLVRCGAGGRNHIPCCRRRGVADGCLNVCAGLVESSPYVVAARCADDLGRILQCMEEGSDLLPGMPVDFHATLVTKDTIHLEWESAPEDANMTIDYQVRYSKSDSDIPLHPLEHTNSVNTTKSNIILNGLEPNTRYSLYVVASNSYGISLPSLVLVVNTSRDVNDDSKMISSNMGPPHAIQVLHQSTDTISFKWMPPLYVPADAKVKYIVHYKAANGTAVDKGLPISKDWQLIETSFNTMFLMNLTFDTEYAITIQAVNDMNRDMRSTLSEVVLVWTDPAIPASVNLPVIIPAGPIVEGSNVTFMCIGVGTPTPILSLLLNGQEVLRQERRHISLTVVDVKRNLTSVSCFATNGFTTGRTSQAAQSTLELRVRFKPAISASPSVTHITRGAPGRLQCEFTGNPQPHVLWFKDTPDGKQDQLSPSTKLSFVTVTHSDQPNIWINSLVFKEINDSDGGDYHCMAVNDLGQDAVSLELLVDVSKNHSSTNAAQCCQALGVHEDCRKVCSFDVDIDQAMGIAECFPDLDKLMTCAADGSDHRSCCRRNGVPSDCIRWCAGLKVTKPNLCSLSSAHDIVACFQEGKALLPGPPLDVHARHILEEKEAKVIVEWSPPKKNPELVQYYRVFWRPVGSRDLNRNQTEEPRFQLEGLDPNKMYEFVVKSGNHYGLSIFTDPLVISMSSARASASVGGQLMRVVLGVCLTAVIAITTGALLIFVYRNYLPRISTMRFLRSTGGGSGRGSVLSSPSVSSFSSSRGVSFENPSYMKDTTPYVQFNAPSNEVEVNANFPDHKMITLTTPT